jgi:hypothetical protein
MVWVAWPTIGVDAMRIVALAVDPLLWAIMAVFAEALERGEPKPIPVAAVGLDVVDNLGRSEDAALGAEFAIGFFEELEPSAFLPACEAVPVPPWNIWVWGSAAHVRSGSIVCDQRLVNWTDPSNLPPPQPRPPKPRGLQHEGAADELRDVDLSEIEGGLAACIAINRFVGDDVGATAHILVAGDAHEVALQGQRTKVDFEDVELGMRLGEERAVERFDVDLPGVENSAPFERRRARLADDGMKDDRLARCGAIISMPSRRNSSSRASLS